MPSADTPMRICVYGAGAVGGNFAERLANAGHSVSVVARGAHLAALRSDGIRVRRGEDESHASVVASDDPASLGAQDLVIVTLKAHALADIADRIAPLLGEDTPIIFAQNGIPWWYAQGLGADRPAPPDLSLLHANQLSRQFARHRVIGGVINSSNDLVAPGIVKNNSPKRNRLVIGEIDDQPTARIAALRSAIEGAGIESPASDDLRARIWDKLISNMRVSLLAFLTGQTSREVWDDPELRPIVDRLGHETLAIAAAHGITCSLDGGGPSPGHKSSMLQDYERGRPQEIDALVTAPQLFARAAGIDTPTVDTIAGLVRSKAATAPRAG